MAPLLGVSENKLGLTLVETLGLTSHLREMQGLEGQGHSVEAVSPVPDTDIVQGERPGFSTKWVA